MNCSESGIYGVPSQQNLYFTNYCVIPGEIAEKVSLSEKRMEASGLLYGVSENLEEDLKQVNEQLSAYDLDGMAAFFFWFIHCVRIQTADMIRRGNVPPCVLTGWPIFWLCIRKASITSAWRRMAD